MKRVTLCMLLICALIVIGLFSASQAKTQITIQGCEGQEAKLIRLLTPEFEKRTGIKVKYDFVSYESVREKQVTQFIGKTGAYDVIMVDAVWLPEYVKSGFLVNLDPYISRTGYDLTGYVPAFQQKLGVLDDTNWALGFAPGVWILAYRKDLYEETGLTEPPQTLYDLLDYAKKLTQDTNGDGEIDQYGISTMAKRDAGTVVEWLHYLWAFGGDWLDEELKPGFYNQAGVEAIEYHKQLMDYAPPGPTGVGIYEHMTQFAAGIGAQAFNYTMWLVNYEKPDLMGSKIAGKLGYTTIPQIGEKPTPSMVEGWDLGIPRDCRNKDEAFKYIAYLTGEEGQFRYATAGGCTARKAPLVDPILVETWPYLKAHYEGGQVAKPKPMVVEYTELEDVLMRELSMALAELKKPEKALEDAYEESYTIMEKGGHYK